MPEKLTQKEVVNRFVNLHGNKFDYSLVEYKGSHSKIKIICKLHNEIFEQSPLNHVNHDGCEKCSHEKSGYISPKSAFNSFIEKASVIHNNKYDYALVSYVHSHKKVKIICQIHGEFEQCPLSHLKGSGCPSCGSENRGITHNKNSKNKFISKINNINNDLYDYSLTKYVNKKTKIKVICKLHGVFEQLPIAHLNGQGCPSCNSSKGSKKIQQTLQSKNINFSTEFRFKDCRDKKPLPFDFAVFEDEEKTKLKFLIEFDGLQHYEIATWYKGTQESFEKCKMHDKIKDDFCKENNIKLIRIPYWEFKNIEERLNESMISSQ